MSTPHCSMIMYLNKDAALIPAFLRDLRSFFAKFPVHYEVIAVVEKNATQSLQLLQTEQSLSPEKERIHIHQNKKHLGRAQSLMLGFEIARSEYLLVVNPEMASPLGDVFKLWQHLVGEDQIDICWGDRYRRKDSPFTSSSSPRIRTEHFFNDLLRGKSPEDIQDPLCEVIALKKQSWNRLRPELKKNKISGWYLAAAIQKCHAIHSFKIIELPVYDSGVTSKSYSVWSERWRLIRRLK
ncbi:glycosyltransferase family 2 protein [Bdellovibrio svalbardensis]|uniref:Glycosyltransferase n=1 Tax=Bdellovibrio svalbardensis TaxID=2972972 RepID=A0ABT6DM64_9BACT|nr:glycosyltransferase [Bdellovibrio svalbardensis]MDG0817888.1 glycosyltransferase [Bdellovibrio svalbardensis]